ncbi:acylphosphatase [Nocardioides sp. Root140]|uniref:acylphosphatase n=1 Tax=Nocardioides sp. Root140 TaxID=1736460 RepID=UPI0007017E53|nr:acylphosphatase [Nocardioides sp. Root140]KQY56710.1 hypothetical protein ASD30_10375 [Nocardioides sp. Root140]
MAVERYARDVVVHGRVQGVFFRATCQQEAIARGVTGWVSNEYDGTVRAHVEGTTASVAAMVRWLSTGPRRAIVERIEVTEATPTGAAGFEVR